MLIKEFQLDRINVDKSSFLSFLVYGPNEGLVRDQIKKIIHNITSKNEYEELALSSRELDEDNYAVDSNLKTVSMFFKGRILIVDTPKDKHLTFIEPVINDAPQNSVLIIKAGNLTKSSKIRKFFESHESCFSLACYDDDAKALMQHVENFISKNNLNIDRDIKNYLMQNLSNDRMINNNELEKINLFIGNTNKTLSLDDAKFLLNDSSSQNLNKMNEAVMYGNTSKSSKIISRLLSEGNNPISLLRSLMNYIIRIQKTKIEMKKGNNFENAVRDLKPPLFWKDKESFQRHCLKWPLKSIEHNLNKLLEAEIICKLNSKLAILNCEKTILLVASSAKQYFKN